MNGAPAVVPPSWLATIAAEHPWFYYGGLAFLMGFIALCLIAICSSPGPQRLDGVWRGKSDTPYRPPGSRRRKE